MKHFLLALPLLLASCVAAAFPSVRADFEGRTQFAYGPATRTIVVSYEAGGAVWVQPIGIDIPVVLVNFPQPGDPTAGVLVYVGDLNGTKYRHAFQRDGALAFLPLGLEPYIRGIPLNDDSLFSFGIKFEDVPLP